MGSRGEQLQGYVWVGSNSYFCLLLQLYSLNPPLKLYAIKPQCVVIYHSSLRLHRRWACSQVVPLSPTPWHSCRACASTSCATRGSWTSCPRCTNGGRGACTHAACCWSVGCEACCCTQGVAERVGLAALLLGLLLGLRPREHPSSPTTASLNHPPTPPTTHTAVQGCAGGGAWHQGHHKH